MATFEFESCIRGYHVYQKVWKAEIGETLECVTEDNNPYDKNAVAVLRDGEVIGHIPRTNSKVCRFFLSRGGQITVVVLGKRENKGVGLQIPALYKFVGQNGDITKLPNLLKPEKERSVAGN